MIQDGDAELSGQQSGGLAAGGNRMWFLLGGTRAAVSTVTLVHDSFSAACKPQTSPVTAQRTLTKCRRHPVIQPGDGSQFGETPERQQTLDLLPDQAQTCQKEPL